MLKYKNGKYEKILTSTFCLVGKNATLAYAKSEMERVANQTGEPCQDIFVTETGNENEAVLGCISDKRLEKYSFFEG